MMSDSPASPSYHRRVPAGGAGHHSGMYVSPSHHKSQIKKMREYQRSNVLCDVTLLANGGDVEISAHRVVLAGASDYFAAMFTSGMHESTSRDVTMHGVEPAALRQLVDYCYTGEIELRENTVEMLLSGSCLLQLGEVVKACSEYLIKQLHPSNCLGIRAFADAQGVAGLLDAAQKYTLEHFTLVAQNAEFQQLSVEELMSLLSSDELNVLSEQAVLQAALDWLSYEPVGSRACHARDVMACVRLALLPPSVLADLDNVTVLRDAQCQGLIFNALKHHLLAGRTGPGPSPATTPLQPRKSTIGYLYAVGGQDSNKEAMSVERYDFLSNKWSVVTQMTSRRLQVGVATLGPYIYIVGGRDGLKTLNTLECYDTLGDNWSQLEPMSVPRHGLGVAILKGPMYAVGGHDGWSYLTTVERYDPESRAWSFVADMATPRSTLGLAVLNDRLYAMGGRDGGQCLRSVECYNPHTNRWSPVASMVKRRGGVGVGVLNGYIYAVGGLDAPSCTPKTPRYGCVERYNPLEDEWTLIAELSGGGRDGIGVCALGGMLFAAGGFSGQTYCKTVEFIDGGEAEHRWHKIADLCSSRAGSCVVAVPHLTLDSNVISSTNQRQLESESPVRHHHYPLTHAAAMPSRHGGQAMNRSVSSAFASPTSPPLSTTATDYSNNGAPMTSYGGALPRDRHSDHREPLGSHHGAMGQNQQAGGVVMGGGGQQHHPRLLAQGSSSRGQQPPHGGQPHGGQPHGGQPYGGQPHGQPRHNRLEPNGPPALPQNAQRPRSTPIERSSNLSNSL